MKYDVSNYSGLIICESTGNNIETSPTIKNLELVDSDRIKIERKKILSSDNYIKKRDKIKNEDIEEHEKILKQRN